MSNQFKLVALLSTLDKREARQVRKMLNSPYFNTQADLKILFEVLIKALDRKKQNIDPEWLFYQISPKLSFDYPRLRKLMNELHTMVLKGLLINKYESNPILSNLTLLSIFGNRKLNKDFKSTIKKTENIITNHPFRNQEYLQNLLKYKKELVKNYEHPRKEDVETWRSISELEDILYLSKKLRTACAQLSFQVIQDHVSDFGLLSLVLTDIEQKKYLDIPAVAIYYYCYKFITEPDEPAHFQSYKKFILKFGHQFSTEDLSDSYRLAINYCIRKNNEGNYNFIRELWELYLTGMDQGILLVNDQLPTFTFDNAVTAGLRLKELSWVKDFIAQKSSLIDPEYREQTKNFNLAKLAYEQNQLTLAMQYLHQIEFKEIRINVVGKIMLLKIYFELEEFDLLSSHVDSFQQFIRRKEVSEYHRKNILSISSYLKKIVGLPEYDKKERNNLREKIKSETILSERDWLLSKLN